MLFQNSFDSKVVIYIRSKKKNIDVSHGRPTKHMEKDFDGVPDAV